MDTNRLVSATGVQQTGPWFHVTEAASVRAGWW